MSKIETLLRRHAEGIITPDELAELNQLTHRDETLRNAQRRARQYRRRASLALSFVAIMAVGAVVLLRNPVLTPSPTLIAQAEPQQFQPVVSVQTDQPAVSQLEPAVEHHPARLVSQEPERVETSVEQPVAHSTVSPNPQPEPVTEPARQETVAPVTVVRSNTSVVACNTACSPDSVISDIWHFLRA